MPSPQSLVDIEVVPPESYPPLLSRAGRQRAMLLLRSGEVLAKARSIIAIRSAELRGAVIELIAQMETSAAAGDWSAVYATAHEIRGLAGTAGLAATGRIANGLCHYLDTLADAGLAPDAAVARLHLDAIARSGRTEDDAVRHGDAVAGELARLVARKLGDIKDAVRDGPA